MENIFEKNKHEFIKFMKTQNYILAVYLFGSFCDLTFHEKSDIDIAVV